MFHVHYPPLKTLYEPPKKKREREKLAQMYKKNNKPRDRNCKDRNCKGCQPTPYCLSRCSSCTRSIVSTKMPEMATALPIGVTASRFNLVRLDNCLPINGRLRRGSLKGWVLRQELHTCSKVECMHTHVRDVDDQMCRLGMEFSSQETSTSMYSNDPRKHKSNKKLIKQH